MFRRGVRTFATSALRLAEPSPHLLAVSKAQGVSNGLTEGITSLAPLPIVCLN
jgi:cysteine synthase A